MLSFDRALEPCYLGLPGVQIDVGLLAVVVGVVDVAARHCQDASHRCLEVVEESPLETRLGEIGG